MKAFVMVGAPGAGKSTYIASLKAGYPDAVVISGDDIREELYGDADIQGNYSEIQDRMLEILSENVGRTVILDGTHCRASYRKGALAMLAGYGYTDISAVVVNRSLDVCIYQNAGRSRKVPEEVIRKMHNCLQSSLRGIDREGFSFIRYV